MVIECCSEASMKSKMLFPARSNIGKRSEDNPIDGWYGLKKGFWGKFGMHVPPLVI